MLCWLHRASDGFSRPVRQPRMPSRKMAQGKRQSRWFPLKLAALLLFGGSRKLFGDVHSAEAESPCNGVTGTLFAFQYFVEPTAINMMPLRKSGLTPFTFNGDSQHAIQVVLVEYDCAATAP
jgi:hypothetical protein